MKRIFLLFILTTLLLSCDMSLINQNTPDNLSVTFNSDMLWVEIDWDDVSDANKYNVYKSENDKNSFKLLNDTYSNNIIDSEVIGGTIYYYKVTSIVNSSESDHSEIKSITLEESYFPDPLFEGTFLYENHWTASNGINETNTWITLKFLGRNLLIVEKRYKNYFLNIGWDTSPDFGDSPEYYTMRFETKDGMSRTKSTDIGAEWSEWTTYNFTGNTLTFEVLGVSYTYEKQEYK